MNIIPTSPNPDQVKNLLALMRLLANRLERLSADSVYAHRASGFRGNLLRQIQRLETLEGKIDADEYEHLQMLTDACYSILVQ